MDKKLTAQHFFDLEREIKQSLALAQARKLYDELSTLLPEATLLQRIDEGETILNDGLTRLLTETNPGQHMSVESLRTAAEKLGELHGLAASYAGTPLETDVKKLERRIEGEVKHQEISLREIKNQALRPARVPYSGRVRLGESTPLEIIPQSRFGGGITPLSIFGEWAIGGWELIKETAREAWTPGAWAEKKQKLNRQAAALEQRLEQQMRYLDTRPKILERFRRRVRYTLGALGIAVVLAGFGVGGNYFFGNRVERSSAQARSPITMPSEMKLDTTAAENGVIKTQEEWVQYWNAVTDGRTFASMPDYYAAFKQLKAMEERGTAEEKAWARRMVTSLREDFATPCLSTSTRIKYEPHNLEATIIHHQGDKNKTLVKEFSRVVVPEYTDTRGERRLGIAVGEPLGLMYLRALFDTEDDGTTMASVLEYISGGSSSWFSVPWKDNIVLRTLYDFERDATDRTKRTSFKASNGYFSVEGDDLVFAQGCRSRGVTIPTTSTLRTGKEEQIKGDVERNAVETISVTPAIPARMENTEASTMHSEQITGSAVDLTHSKPERTNKEEVRRNVKSIENPVLSAHSKLLYDDFDDNDLHDWNLDTELCGGFECEKPTVSEGVISGKYNGYSVDPYTNWMIKPFGLRSASFSLEVRAVSGAEWPNTVHIHLLTSDYQRAQDKGYRFVVYGESGRSETERLELWRNNTVLGAYSIGASIHEFHTYKLSRGATGNWRLWVDGKEKSPSFSPDLTYSTFGFVAINLHRNQSAVDWIRLGAE
ncbi:hypothetical protein HYS48_02725 [Candidatus Woesearchaeota archaeon]|nr:hypothetical protein [Candidatus Woesearchaeota archaeon]